MTRMRFATALMMGVAMVPPAAHAATLTIGSSTEPSAIDPHFSRTGNNQNIAMQIFDRLVTTDANMQIHPGLAESWTNLDPKTWRIKLRAGVKFHDGKVLTADDVIFSLTRARAIPNSPAPFTGNVAMIASMKAVDPLTIEMVTKDPTPDLMDQVGFVYIVEKAVAEGKSLDDFNKGVATIGTGPYKFQQWVPADHLNLLRNEEYWGRKPDFENVAIRFIANDAARVAALRAGNVDLIDSVPPNDVATLSAQAGIRIYSTPSARMIYLALDTVRDESPFVTGADGKALKPSPLKDLRVRQALSKLINRDLIIDRILQGSGTAAAQLVPDGVAGNEPSLVADKQDVDGAKKLLADAGFAGGFGLTIHTSNDRFPGDAGVAQAIGQMFARGGLKINGVVAQPYNVYATAASKQQFSAFIFSIGNTTPTSATNLKNLLATYNAETGSGSFNRLRYSNPAFDAKLREAMSEFDFDKRIALLRAATKIGFGDMPVVPLYWQKVHWAAKAGVAYQANKEEGTTATLASVAK